MSEHEGRAPGRDQDISDEDAGFGRSGQPPARPARSGRVARSGGKEGTDANAEGVRLQKVLAAAGIASRRKAEEMIAMGRVKVDGLVVKEQGRRVDPDIAVVHVDGNRVVLQENQVYLALNKMPGWLSTMQDEDNRPHIGQLVEDRTERLFHVGRLDRDSEGLLLLTNDGELAHRLTHPSYGVAKTYMAEIPGPVPRDLGRRLKKGIELEDGMAKVDSFEIVDVHAQRAVVEVVLHEGRKHIVRRLLDAAGHPVSRLVRTQIGELQLGHQRPGTLRKLSPVEIALLYKAVDL
ncbi:rRNA pseudouridine synthase [Nakamurella flavida]|uniref:Pseudouridine synthase n=1 Tax=Nakamurella flavida TaxID=363630 RepID=A0A938YID7_9ACTN|nr:pseudouridine synthase [Nakamurella flavida]MBM9478251.1 rRNA pseudouridine synthase [Nakamurella flavida]MDP9777578.1 23S rRNA pseudouridine2605 synthase [Nakamurella flavida]